ncbi:methylenetetrahydrofolate reductase [Stakelama sp. CBK3Z-3]|uniref:Methylenetetrahydrofolate reductase n=1 Tax=Stakelama flava TaxID=2860338 RepID=A0ABS6XMX3_9SPHN|nr:methylenetetrahydrofolate reductase [Stakelama flava]MBW4330795.1 methylenetetrahydrofolate reductase [Stakelama flava]
MSAGANGGRPIVHPAWLAPHETLIEGYSLEVTAKDIDALIAAAPRIWSGAPIAVPYLPNESHEARVAAAKAVRELGFEPMPHFSARRIESREEFARFLHSAVREAGVERCFVVAGDPAEPEGPFADSMAMIETGAFEAAGVKVIGVGGHPEGHPVMSPAQCWQALETKCAAIEARSMAPLIVTQFAFEADAILSWLQELRARGLDYPVRIGVPGPAGIKTLIRFAAMCGVGASAAVLSKYGISLGRLVGPAGPDRFLDALRKGLGPEHGAVRLHFYPFGGIAKTIDWITAYAARRAAS